MRRVSEQGFSVNVGLVQELQQSESVVGELFLKRALEQGRAELGHDRWTTSARSLDVLGTPLVRYATEHHESILFDDADKLYAVTRWGSHVDVQAAAGERAALEALFERLRTLLPAPDPSSAQEVNVTFWTYTPHGPQPSWRSIAVPNWGEIQANYTASTRTALGRLMDGFQPAHGGQLVLWHGLAGTGKTFALRALAWEWREWCEFHYIVDPDSFFGEHADYLMSVLMQEGAPISGAVLRMGHFSSHHMVTMATSSDEEDEDKPERAWRVLVLEDTGELLTPDARTVIGQGLSRFLNVVDGLIGQGLRVLVLVTTNEPLDALHPAVARPGRCAANIDFGPLSDAEAAQWLAAHGVEVSAAAESTLATLYAQAEQRDPVLAEFAQE
jgi:hypothetical protein